MVPLDGTFRLTQQDRKRLRPGFDVSALEKLLGHIPASRRGELLSYFLRPETSEIRELWYIGDPVLQELLEEVWAPTWDRVPDSEIAADTSQRPGKGLALQRRRATN